MAHKFFAIGKRPVLRKIYTSLLAGMAPIRPAKKNDVVVFHFTAY
jgi:hypothetical protein